jgi:hypothetical protein
LDTFGIPGAVLNCIKRQSWSGRRLTAKDQQQGEKPTAELCDELERCWNLKTPYLEQLAVTHPTRARAAERWRPSFLAMLTLTASPFLSARKAGIKYDTYKLHLRKDPEFAAQVREAQEQAAQVLHAACWKSAIEGVLVGHIKKYDSRIRVELLRAHMPDKFKRNDRAVSINVNNRQQFLVTPDVADDLARRWRESCERRARAQQH